MNVNVVVAVIVVSSICCSRPLTQSKEIFIFIALSHRGKAKKVDIFLSIDFYGFSAQFRLSLDYFGLIDAHLFLLFF